ncbi:MAG: transglutaminase-like cysteine peptidase [Sphingomonas bacterium]|nr:transglutaminase-like cysteine peptidase [Sphingomonas bacterium]
MEHVFRPRYALGLLAGLTIASAAMPAQAQSLNPSSAAGLSKAEAILGGTSSLAAILAAQANGSTAIPAADLVQPGLYPRPRAPLFGIAPDEQPDLYASPDRPDVFNSVALRINQSPLDDRWRKVGLSGVHGADARFAAALRGQHEQARIEAVNEYVNARISFVDDIRQYGVADRWTAAADTLARGRGDCEDYALAKMAMLRKAGFAEKDLYLVVLKDLVRRADHAVLVVRSAGRFMVLDNSTNRLVDSAEVRDYRPILTFTAGQRFTHGYRRNAVTAPMLLAAAEQQAQPTLFAIAPASGLPTSSFASR